MENNWLCVCIHTEVLGLQIIIDISFAAFTEIVLVTYLLFAAGGSGVVVPLFCVVVCQLEIPQTDDK